jgi:hypothetical protein
MIMLSIWIRSSVVDSFHKTLASRFDILKNGLAVYKNHVNPNFLMERGRWSEEEGKEGEIIEIPLKCGFSR